MIRAQWENSIKAFNDHSIVPEGEWEQNTAENIKRLHRSNSIWTMEGDFNPPNDRAVIVVGASPCLKRDVEKLKDCDKEDFCVVAVNSALKFMLDSGVTPEYVVALDSDHKDIEKHLDVDSKDLTLIASNVVSPRVLDSWKGKILYFPYFAVSEKYKKRLRNRLGKMIPVGGNALATMVSTAIQVWNARIIILAASECCYDKHYYPSKDIARNNAEAAEFYVTDINGKQRVTTTALHTYKLWLERLAIHVTPNVKIIDSSQGILGVGKSYIYTYELSKIIKIVKDAIEKKKEIIKNVEGHLSDASLYQQRSEQRVHG